LPAAPEKRGPDSQGAIRMPNVGRKGGLTSKDGVVSRKKDAWSWGETQKGSRFLSDARGL